MCVWVCMPDIASHNEYALEISLSPGSVHFIHDALRELVVCGDTEMAAANLRTTFNRLNAVAEGGRTDFQKQFQVQ